MMNKLPDPPSGKSGWPWTRGSKPLPSVMPNGKPWPKISIVTPSFNQGRYLEETIRSVLLQNYPNLEYIIMDGGSTDNSVDIIKKYEPWLTYWVSAKDHGQADAINNGFRMATGHIIGWLNSDDYFLRSCLSVVAKSFIENPHEICVTGGVIIVDDSCSIIRKCYSYAQNYDSLLTLGQFNMQMSTFWLKTAYELVGGLDTSLQFCFDYDLFLKLAKIRKQFEIDALLAAYRVHRDAKSSTIVETAYNPELRQIREKEGYLLLPEKKRREDRFHFESEFHLKQRKGVIKDSIRDYRYFMKKLWMKLV